LPVHSIVETYVTNLRLWTVDHLLRPFKSMQTPVIDCVKVTLQIPEPKPKYKPNSNPTLSSSTSLPGSKEAQPTRVSCETN